MIDNKIVCYDKTEEYDKAGLKIVENTSEEILDLAREMNERIDGTWKEMEEDKKLQEKYWSLFPEDSLNKTCPARIGALFLRKNRELLG